MIIVRDDQPQNVGGERGPPQSAVFESLKLRSYCWK